MSSATSGDGDAAPAAFDAELRARTQQEHAPRSTPARSASVSGFQPAPQADPVPIAADATNTEGGVLTGKPAAPERVASPEFETASKLATSADPIETLLFLQQLSAEELVEGSALVEDAHLDASTPAAESGVLESLAAPVDVQTSHASPVARTTTAENGSITVQGELGSHETPPTAPEAAEQPRPPSRADEARANEILRQVRVAIAPRFEHALIQLHPAELGRISIQLRVEEEGLVAQVRAERREALEALEKHVPELRAALSRQGIQVGGFDLALGFHDGSKPDDTRGRRSSTPRERDASSSIDDTTTTNRVLRRILTEGAIDTYA